MLYLLTGEIQTGKTRWLEARLAEAEAAGVEVHGVLSPGVWVPAEDGSFEKQGIDLVFYPSHEHVRFADRLNPDDVTDADDDGYDEPEEAQEGIEELTGEPLEGEAPAPCPMHADGRILGWKFYSYWFGRVNDLFAELRKAESADSGSRRLVVIDEIGRLELAGRGFSEAVSFLLDGENPAWPDVVAVVRSELLDRARTLLDPVWGSSLKVIRPE